MRRLSGIHDAGTGRFHGTFWKIRRGLPLPAAGDGTAAAARPSVPYGVAIAAAAMWILLKQVQIG